MKPKFYRSPRIRFSRHLILTNSIAAAFFWMGTATSHAATFKWDAGNPANGATIDAASGTWNKTAGNIVWNDAGTNKIWTDANDAVFEGTDGAYTLTVGTSISANKLIFSNSGYTLSAASPQTVTLTPGSTSAIEIATSKSATIGSNLTVQKTVVNTGTGGMTIGATGGAAAGKLTIAAGATVKSTSSGGNSAMYLSGNGLVLDISGSLGRSSNAVAGTGTNDDTTHIGSNAADNVTVNVKTGGSYATGGRTMRIGSTGTAVMNVEGGSFSMLSSTTTGHVYLGYNAGSNATVNVSAGSFSTNPGDPANGHGQLIVGLNLTSTALLKVTGGTVNAYGRMVVSGGSSNATVTLSDTGKIVVGGLGLSLAETAVTSKGTFNLNGGTLTTPEINRVKGEATFNFNGGIVKAAKSNAAFMQANADGIITANVHDGGALIDTNGFDITVAQALTHSVLPGAAAIDGGLTKSGAGMLILTSPDLSYTGRTTINDGILSVNSVSFPSHGGLTIGSAGTFKVRGSLNSAGDLASQGTLGMANGDINTLSIANGITLNNSTLSFDLADGIADDIIAGGAAVLTGTNTINLSLIPGEALTTHTYTILTSTGGLSASNFTIGSRPPGFNTFTLSTPNPNELVLSVTAGNATPATAYWTGKASSTGSPTDSTNLWGYGSTLAIPKSNWSSTADGLSDPLQIPAATTHVILTATGATHTSGTLATKLDANYAIQGLTFDVPASTGITSTSIDTNGSTLSIGADGITLSSGSSSGGIIYGTGSLNLTNDLTTIQNQSGTRALTVATPVNASQLFSVLTLGGAGAGGIALTGGLGNGPGSLALSINTPGLVTLGGACTYTGDTELVTGKLLVENTNTFASKLTLTNALADAVTFHQDTQNLVLPNSKAITGGGGIVKTGPGSLTLGYGASSYTGGTVVNGGTLLLNTGSVGFGAGIAPGDVSTAGVMDPTNVVAVNTGATLAINGTAPFGNSTLLPQYSASVVVNAGGILTGNAFVVFVPNLTLNGGTVQVGNGNTTGGFNTNIGLVGTVQIGGATPSSITTTGTGTNARLSLGGATAGNNGVIFNVADVTGDTAVDFTISSIVRNAGTNAIPLVSPLTKTGPGTMMLTAANTYTGTTTVSAGELILGTASLADAADVVIGATAILQLTHGGLDTVHALTIGGVQLAAGTYGAAGIANPHITGTGSLVVTTGPVAGYDTWANVIPNAADRDRTDDPDGDGFNNLSEYLFGTSPIANDGAQTLATPSGGNLIVRWSQRKTGTFVLQESATLLDSPWPASSAPVGDAADQSGLYSADYVRREAVVPINSDQKFVRVFATE